MNARESLGTSIRQLGNMRLWLIPGMGVKRHVALAVVGTLLLIGGVISTVLWFLGGNRQALSEPIETVLISSPWQALGGWLSFLLILLGIFLTVLAVGRLNRSLLSHWMPQPNAAAEVLHQRLSLSKGPRIVALGGGTGLSKLLRGLRRHTSNITAVVTVSDDGGSSGRLRDAFDMPAPGDITDCLAALSDNESDVSRLLQYRFSRGGELEGHTFGNLLITTLTEVERDFGKAIRVLNSVLNLTGAVYPVTSQAVSLKVVKASGVTVTGESKIREVEGAIQRLTIEPAQPVATPEVIQNIQLADLVVLGPGSLYTSTLPPVLVPQTRQALLETRATLVYICNIMTEPGETDHYSAKDHLDAIRRHLGRYPDWVVINADPVDEGRIKRYKAQDAEVVPYDVAALERLGIKVATLPLLGHGPRAQHDAEELARWLTALAKTVTRNAQASFSL